ncbi:hypothetical protein RMATCC62417_18492 [Rhizopus microsporus]|nr:hypothetical protein RMATCC62417_18492 [Rhizopus microsporus]
MLMDSEPYWEGNYHDTGDWRSTPSCEISTEGPSKSTEVTQQQLEYTMSGKPKKSTGARVAVKRVPLKNGLPARHKPLTPGQTVYVNASDSGWKISSASVQTAGSWSAGEKEDSINVRELKTILFALQVYLPQHKNSTLQIYSGNTTALKYVNKAGRTSSKILQELAIQIKTLCNKHNVRLVGHHIPGIQNTMV